MYWLIGSFAAVALLAAIACKYLLKMRSELYRMAPLPTGEVVHTVTAIRDGYVNLYLIQDGDRYVAIDAGKNRHTVEEELRRMRIDGAKVMAVLLTHTDRDHVGALSLFRTATVYVPEPEEALLNGTVHRVLIFGNRVSGPYEKIGDNAEMKFGNIRVRSIVTPGHTPGSTCYMVNDKFLFTGDSLSLKNGLAGPFSRFFNMDTRIQMRSLEKISRLPGVEYLFTAHHGFTDNYAKAFERTFS
jgi:hydroxyacylglutathione hydrolase